MNRKIYIIIGLVVLTIGLAGIYACKNKTTGSATHNEHEMEIDHYTCPMHPHIHSDKPGECPICHMRLVPVYKEGESPSSEMDPGAKPTGPTVSISTQRQQTIGVTTAPLMKKSMTKTIRTVGQVAFDPELATAQREFLDAARHIPSLKKATENRLRILGMSDEEIKALEKRDSPDSALILPKPGENLWVYSPVFGNETALVKEGSGVTLTISDTGETLSGIVRGMEPKLNDATRSSRVRIEVTNAEGKIRPGMFLDAVIEVHLGDQLAVPKSSVIQTGTRQIVFVVKEKTRFESREVKLGPETDDEWAIRSGLSEGEVVATNAVFLIDSESRLKAAVSGMEGHSH